MNALLKRFSLVGSVWVVVMLVFTLGVEAKEPYAIPATHGKVKIDGTMNEETWKDALILDLKYEVKPGENIPAPVYTQVFLMHDKSHFYVGFRALDPDPGAIRACIRERDSFGGDDWVAVAIDSLNDNRLSYSFICNPLGIQADEISSPEGGGESWDAIWKSAGRITKEGYVVEMAIPFSSMRFERSRHDKVWGIDAVRSYPRNVRHLFSIFPWDRNNNCYMCQAEKIKGLANVSPGNNILLAPTLTGIFSQQRENQTSGEFHKKESKLDPGLTAIWGFTPNMALSLAINPDFSNIEADVPELDINRRFAIYYPEKRPFFLESASIFSTRFQAVYTRALADPQWGVKVTGKEGKHAIGFFSVKDRFNTVLLPGSQSSRPAFIDDSVVGSVLRYRHDVGRSSTIGLLVTDREGTAYFNRLLGFDGDFLVTRKDRVRFQWLGSSTRYPLSFAWNYLQTDKRFTGSAVDFYYLHDSKTFDWYGDYCDVSAGFRADLGFIPQAGYKNYELGGAHTWYQRAGHWFTALNIATSFQLQKNQDNQELAKLLTLKVNYAGPAQSTLNLIGNFGTQTYGGKEFNNNYFQVNGSIIPSSTLNFYLYTQFGDCIDLENLRQASHFRWQGVVDWKYGRHLQFQLNHKFERVHVAEGRLYTANVSYLRFMYHFDRRIFLRTILKYVDYTYNTALYNYAKEAHPKHLFSQVLLAYEVNPQTVIFLGYSDDYYGYQGIPITQANRTFFLKVGYALVL